MQLPPASGCHHLPDTNHHQLPETDCHGFWMMPVWLLFFKYILTTPYKSVLPLCTDDAAQDDATAPRQHSVRKNKKQSTWWWQQVAFCCREKEKNQPDAGVMALHGNLEKTNKKGEEVACVVKKQKTDLGSAMYMPPSNLPTKGWLFCCFADEHFVELRRSSPMPNIDWHIDAAANDKQQQQR